MKIEQKTNWKKIEWNRLYWEVSRLYKVKLIILKPPNVNIINEAFQKSEFIIILLAPALFFYTKSTMGKRRDCLLPGLDAKLKLPNKNFSQIFEIWK
jgi:hypothetical protein